MRYRLLGFVVMFAVLGGTGEAFTSGSVHEAIRYGIALLTGAFIGVALAVR